MKKRTRIMALTSGGLAVFALALAASAIEPPPPPDQDTSTKMKVPERSQPSKAAPPSGAFDALRSGDLLGKAVRGTDDTKLGEIENCLIEMPQGRVAACLVGSGGILGIGETFHAVPVTVLRYNEIEHTLALDLDKQGFRRGPAFDTSHPEDMQQLAAAYRQFGQEPYWSAGGTRQPVREADEARESPAVGASSLNLTKATQLIHSTVRDSAQQELGEVHDFVLDLKAGRLLYIVLGQGGILGVGEKLYPIPPTAFTVSDAGKAVVLNTTREQLDRAPQFTKDTWPGLNDPKWASDVYAYYHAPMYWQPGHFDPGKGATELMRQPVRQADDRAPGKTDAAPSSSGLAGKIMDALRADESLASVADRIQIVEDKGDVTLTGQVKTEEQKTTAEKVARNTIGVASVVNRITVGE
jgi:sporulation protein YlmC with PRC-barrel domain